MIMENIDFGMAVSFLERDTAENIVSRKGWNGKGMYVKICDSIEITVGGETKKLEGHLVIKNVNGTFSTKKLERHFVIKNVNGTFSTWVPSVNDCLAKDWVGSTLTEDKNKVLSRNI